MIDLWLRSGPFLVAIVPFAFFYLLAAAIVWLTHLSPARPFFASCVGVVGPFFASVGVLFSLFAAFLANDVRQQSNAAETAVAREADGVRTVLRLTESLGDAGRGIQEAAIGYARAVLEREWPVMRKGEIVDEDLGPLRRLTVAIVDPGPAVAAREPVAQALMAALIEIRQARLERILLTADQSAPVNWLGVVILGVLTQVAVAVVQLDKLRPQAMALFVFTTACAATIVLIGLYARPFAPDGVSDLPLRQAIASATV